MKCIASVALLTVLACRPSANSEELSDRARNFLVAANAQDSLGLARRAASSDVVNVALTAARTEAGIFGKASHSLTFVRADGEGDTIRAFFQLGAQRIAIGFAKRDTTWLVNYLGFPDRD